MKQSTVQDIVTEDAGRADSCFHRGSNPRAYRYLGAHIGDDGRVLFRLFAPNADRVSVCGDFNSWDFRQYPMEQKPNGIWELTLPQRIAPEGCLYKYCVFKGSRVFYKADPYGYATQKPPATASVLCDLSGYAWRDAGWLSYRKGYFTGADALKQPINVYEIHPGSWKRHGDGSFYSYRDLAADLLPYVKQMGYTHVELMPVLEHPADDSWGYLPTGYFAPSARFGGPLDFMAFVDAMHEGGVGVILDWVPAHFPRDEHGLACFDGRPVYEHNDPNRAETAWGSLYFDLKKPQVQSFLISSAVFWAEQYHIDGLRVDAVASMLYPGVDTADKEAIAFFQRLNSRMQSEFPDVMMIAEDSSAHPGITGFHNGGLGFTFKWNMGWMNDTLSYLSEDPLWRKYHHHKMTFAMSYHHSERFLLPLSHDEVVHGKRSIIGRAPGEYEQRFANLRAYYLWQIMHPGKKLSFMGNEIGQFQEWGFDSSIEWFLLDYPMHAKLQLFVSCINRFYLSHPALWEQDYDEGGFSWMDADNEAESIYSFCRRSSTGEELVAVFHFLPVDRVRFLLRVPRPGIYRPLLDTDAVTYGGSGRVDTEDRRAEQQPDGSYAISITLSPMSARIYRMV